MQGPEGAVELLRSYLAANVPAKIVELRTRLAVTGEDLRTPQLYSASIRERLEVKDYPSIEVQFQAMGNPVYLANGNTQLTWQIPYKVRVYSAERGNTYDQVEERRKRIFLAVIEVIGFNVKLASTPNVWVDFKSLTGSFFGASQLADARDNRSIAASYLEMNVIVEEMTEPAATLGTANTVQTSVHPAMR